LTGFGVAGSSEGWCKASNSGNGKLSTSHPHAQTPHDIFERKQVDIQAFGAILWELMTGKIHAFALNDKTQQQQRKNKNKGKAGNSCILSKDVLDRFPPTFTALMQQCLTCRDAQVSSSPPTNSRGFEEVCETVRDILNGETKRMKDRAQRIPDGFLCPITQDVMKDPVILADGHSYERKAIIDWLKRSNRSPLTNEELPTIAKDGKKQPLVGNYALKSAIASYLEMKEI
jgi:hypothetical protein